MTSMSVYMEGTARDMKADVPESYGYKAVPSLSVGFFVETNTTCHLLEKPVCIPHGSSAMAGYLILYAYCSEEGMESLLNGQLPPIMPATVKEPKEFESLADIANNFGMQNPESKTKNSKYCVALRVPAELATKAETPGRDLWIVRFDQDIISPFLQASKEGDAIKVSNALKAGMKGTTMDEHGVSALMMAAMAGSAPTCKVLLDNGAEINHAEPKAQRTALMFAAQGGMVETVKLLLHSKADASKVDSEGSSALTWAAVSGTAEIAKLLLNHCKAAHGWDGKDAIATAEKMGHKDTVAALQA